MQDSTRAAALAKLAELGVKADPTATSPAEVTVTVSDKEPVYAGGDVERVLVSPAHLTYREEKGGQLLHAFAEVGDTVLLTSAQAKRLDGLEVTVTKAQAKKLGEAPAAPAPAAAPDASTTTDEDLQAMSAAELVAHVNQHPGDRVRVRALEGQRDEPRVTVLRATAPDGDDEDEELDDEE
jgi:hypothetical protein